VSYWCILLDHPISILDLKEYINSNELIQLLSPLNVANGYDQRDVANSLKRFLIDQSIVKFFLLIGPLNALKHL